MEQIKKRLIEKVLKYGLVLQTSDVMEDFVRDARCCSLLASETLKLRHSQITFVSLMRKQDR